MTATNEQETKEEAINAAKFHKRRVFVGVSADGQLWQYRFDSPYAPETEIVTRYKIFSDGALITWQDEANASQDRWRALAPKL